MKHLDLIPDKVTGLTDGLVRFSVGCEDVEDIIADIKQALDQV